MRKFTEDEIREIVRATQVFAPQFTREQYQALVGLGQELANSELIESASLVRQLAQEHGIPWAEVPGLYQRLLKERAKLQAEVDRLQERKGAEEKQLAETTEASRRAEAERSREEKELASYKRQAEKEKRRLKEQVGQAMKEAEVERKEIVAAGRFKAEAHRYGLTPELALKLLGEYAGDQDALTHLAEHAAEHGSQLKARASLEEEKEALALEVEQLRQEGATLSVDCQRQRETYNRLTSQLKEQEALRHFWGRYRNWSGLLECLASWGQLLPMRCDWFLCRARFWVDHGPTNFRSKHTCPCCGVGLVYPDERVFTATGQPYGVPIQVTLG
jgi:hypothetical protein